MTEGKDDWKGVPFSDESSMTEGKDDRKGVPFSDEREIRITTEKPHGNEDNGVL